MRHHLILTVAAGVLTVSGATAIAVGVAAQRHAPQPPPSAAGSLGPKTQSTAGRLGSPVVAAVPATSASSSPDPTSSVAGLVLPSSRPVAIGIPAIGVRSSLLYVGLTAENTVEVPAPGPQYNLAAWYKYSSTPGSLGPAVIIGHVDSAAQGPSVFFNLGDLQPGDKVLVTRGDGLVAVFRVDGVRLYPKDHFPTQLVYGANDHAVLRLVTCGGPFDHATGHYLDNIVVFASLVGSHEVSGA